MPDRYTMKPRYKEEEIEINSVKPHYKFPRNIVLKSRRLLLDVYRLLPEHWRDKIEDFGKNGFSSNFRNMVIADWFSHTFFIGNGGREMPPEPPVTPEPDFVDRIRHHVGPHHGGPHHGGPHHGGPDHDGPEL